MIDPWRIERACRAAWPAVEELEVDGWIARLSGGDTRRPNSVNPAGPEAADPVGLIDRLRTRYAARACRSSSACRCSSQPPTRHSLVLASPLKGAHQRLPLRSGSV